MDVTELGLRDETAARGLLRGTTRFKLAVVPLTTTRVTVAARATGADKFLVDLPENRGRNLPGVLNGRYGWFGPRSGWRRQWKLGLLALAAMGVLLGACQRRTASYRSFLTRTEAGNTVRWTRREIALVPVEPRKAVSSAALLEALRAAAAGWNRALQSCHAPKLLVMDLAPATRAVGVDGVSSVVVRTHRWCPDRALDDAGCYERQRTAVTHLYPAFIGQAARDGEMREADIEINAIDYQWAGKSGPGVLGLRAVLAHELGHVLGLDHSCVPAALRPKNTDGHSVPPPCTSVNRDHSIMYPGSEVSPSEEVLEPGLSEVEALCGLYEKSDLGGGLD